MLGDESYFESDLIAVRRAAEDLFQGAGSFDFSMPVPTMSGRGQE